MFRLPSGAPPRTLTAVPAPAIPQVGQENVIVFPEGAPTIGDVAEKLMIPASGVTGTLTKSMP
jgi:hypothetical protein